MTGAGDAGDAPQGTVAPGTRLRCETCGAEAIVLQPGAADLTCCGAPLTVTFDGSKRA
jgi:desulfoferrodoxin-like iron-binding protein